MIQRYHFETDSVLGKSDIFPCNDGGDYVKYDDHNEEKRELEELLRASQARHINLMKRVDKAEDYFLKGLDIMEGL